MSYESLRPHWNGLKRTPLKRKSGLNKVSKMKHRRDARFVPKEIVDMVIQRSREQCECIDVYRCPVGAIEIHHILPRSRGGKHTLDNLIHLCLKHHRIAHQKPLIAKALGILK